MRFVRLDLHSAATAKSLLAPPKFPVNPRQVHWNSGGKACQGGHQTFAVGFAGGFVSQHHAFLSGYRNLLGVRQKRRASPVLAAWERPAKGIEMFQFQE
jgi:hypothetical protein